jgi:hypothetical protein
VGNTSASKRNIFGADRDGFRERQSAALRRRLNTGVTGKMLAKSVGVHPDSVMNWLHGRVTMDGVAVATVHAFFTAHGDHGFLSELYGQAAVPRPRGSSPFPADLCLWFADGGAVHEAPIGHARFVQDALKVSAEAEDLSSYAIRNLGWIECLVRTDGRTRLRYALAVADPKAATRARDWLLSAGQYATDIDLAVWRDGDWENLSPAGILDAARILDRAGVATSLDRIAERDWTVEKLSVEGIKFPGLAAVVASVREGSEPLKAIAGLDLMDTSSLFAIDRGDVTSLWIGPTLGLPNEDFVGRNVLDRSDRNYAALIHCHVLQAISEGPTYYRLNIEISGRKRHYERVAFPQGPNLVVTSTRLLETGAPV